MYNIPMSKNKTVYGRTIPNNSPVKRPKHVYKLGKQAFQNLVNAVKSGTLKDE